MMQMNHAGLHGSRHPNVGHQSRQWAADATPVVPAAYLPPRRSSSLTNSLWRDVAVFENTDWSWLRTV